MSNENIGSFSDLANIKGSDVKPPVTLPIGHYNAMIAAPAKEHKAKSGNVAMRFGFQLLSAGDDVDQEKLAEAAPEGLPDKHINLDFWMSPDARFRFTDFARSCGIDVDNLNLIEIATELFERKQNFLIECKHEPNEDPNKPAWVRWDNPVGDA